MPEFLANFSTQITEYWGKFTNKQKIQIISIFTIGLVALGLLTFILSRPTYVVYDTEIAADQMQSMVTALTDAGIKNRYSDNATTLEVESSKYEEARLILAEQGFISTDGFRYAEAFTNSLTTTSDERDLKFQLAFETEINDFLEQFDTIEEATVKFVIPDEKTYIFQDERQASASIVLKLNGKMDEEQAAAIASLIEELVPNLSMENIKIMDTSTTKLIFNGSASSTVIGGVNSYMEIQELYGKQYNQNMEMLLLSSTEYDAAEVFTNLDFDFDEVSTESEAHTSPADADTSYPTRAYIFESTGSSSDASGIPGTNSNDATTYTVDTGGGTDSTTSISEQEFAVDTTVTRTIKAVGVVQHSSSSVSVVLNKYKYYYQDTLEADGTLAETSWLQYKRDNKINAPIEVEQSMVDFVANASRISDVSIIAYEVPIFIDTEPIENQVANYIPVIIIVLMIAMLGYAVYRGTEPVEITEVEPELSVEDMLATTNKVSDELDAIEMNDRSEARIQIERFVDENPEAVASLLRNWLNEDWE